MKIKVAGFDPSLTHWGFALATLDLQTGTLEDVSAFFVEPIKETKKQVRQNSIDLSVAEQLSIEAFKAAKSVKAIFAEVPVGSQSARAMASYGVCVGIIGSIRSQGYPVIEVTATEVKEIFTGNKNASKRQMIDQAVSLYPEVKWPKGIKNPVADNAEHMADALASIHAGVRTPVFQNIMRLLAKV